MTTENNAAPDKPRRRPATKKQVLANRKNAKRSTGPRTPNGKAIARLNALRHGLTADVVLPLENDKEFEKILSGYGKDHPPADQTAAFLVTRVAKAHWRMRGFDAHESKVLHETELEFDEEKKVTQLDAMCRYGSHIERTYYRAVRELERHERTRKARRTRRKGAG
jgi:hypothetical protein